MKKPFFRKSLIAAAVAAASTGAVAGWGGLFGADEPAPAPARPPAEAAPAPSGNVQGLPNFSGIVAQNAPAVVNISISGNTKVVAPNSPQIDPDDPFSEFFHRFQPPMPQDGVPARGMGSGFIVSPDGVILTNAHVVDGASEVTVKLHDRREFTAKIVGLDKPTDTAVLKIDAKDLPAVRLGNPAQTKVGDWVLAIGSPFGFESTVTAGIVSAKARSLPDESYVPFIQTDVAVNPGNSGGPLFNLQGEVIGVNSQIYSRTGGYQGLSFAIPIDVAMTVERQLLAEGKVSRGRLGIGIQDMDQALANSFGLNKPTGALVGSVENGSPAAKAGLQPGDVILKFNGKPIEHSSELPLLVGNLKPGTEAELTLWRNGGTQDVTVEAGEYKVADHRADPAEQAPQGRLGLAVRPLTPEERQETDIQGGLVVERAAGPAAKAGIQPGDVVLGVNGQPVKDVEQLRELSAKVGRHVALLVQRGNARIYVPVELG